MRNKPFLTRWLITRGTEFCQKGIKREQSHDTTNASVVAGTMWKYGGTSVKLLTVVFTVEDEEIKLYKR